MFLLVKYLLTFALPAAYLVYRHYSSKSQTSTAATVAPAEADTKKPLKSIMQPPRSDLAPPKDDPITTEELKQYDGSDPSKPIYVAIKGAIQSFLIVSFGLSG